VLLDSHALVICPNNPFISVGPILAVPGVREALRETPATVAAITPIIGGKAIKGPAADMLRDLGHEVSACGVAAMYSEFVDVFVLDNADARLKSEIAASGMRVLVTDTVMSTPEKKNELARKVIEAASDAAIAE